MKIPSILPHPPSLPLRTLIPVCPDKAVDRSFVRLRNAALVHQLSLALPQKLHPLQWGNGRLEEDSRGPVEDEALERS